MTTAAENGQQTLALLQQETAAVRERLRALHEQLAASQSQWARDHGAQLIEANAALVDAALQAQAEAQAAVAAMSAAAQNGQTDALTGLPNRALFADRLHQAITIARRDHSRLALLFVDVDGLKQINDELGHPAGDVLLQHVAHALQLAVRESDTVSRHGGDEFLILLPAIGSDADVAAVADKLLLAVASPCRVAGKAVSASASIGICIFPGGGESAAELIAHADAAMYRAKRERRGSAEFHQTPADGQPAASALVTALHPAAGRLAADDLLIRDTNERLLLNALQQTDFMAMVAHEFRTPLASISNAAMLLQHPKADAGMVERLGPLLARQVGQLTRLASDLMAATSSGSDQFRLEWQQFDLADLVGVAAEACRPGLDAKRQDLVQKLDGGPWQVQADPVRIAQVLRNLFDNASKYSHEGGHISISLRGLESMIEVTIADDGIGLRPAALHSVFGLFAQEDQTSKRSAPGLGIGLGVAKQLIEAHGGRIEARSAGLGQGSQFVFSLRRAN